MSDDQTQQPVPSASQPRQISRRHAVAFCATLFIVASVIGYFSKHGDLHVYLKAADRFWAGEQFYRPDDAPAFTYPPFAILPFLPMSGWNETAQRICYATLNGAFFATIGWLLISLTGLTGPSSERSRWWMKGAWIIVGVLSLRFVISPLEYKSNDLFVFALVMAGVFAWSRDKNLWAGASFGLAAAFKATPLLFLPVLIWQRRFGGAAMLMIALGAATVVPDVVQQSPSGELWAVDWYQKFISKVEVAGAAEADGAWSRWNPLNQSLSGTVYRLMTPIESNGHDVFNVAMWKGNDSTIKMLTLASKLLVLLAIAWGTWPRNESALSQAERSFRRCGEAGLVLCGMLLLSPMSSKQHFCVLVVPIVVMTLHVVHERRNSFAIGALAVVFCLGTCTAKDLVGRPWGNFLQAGGAVTFCAVACLMGTLAVLELRKAKVEADAVEEDASEASTVPMAA
ncbi:glycosyltransferase family 87 protein [Calycomorphotria hydatis]|uniref:Polyprenol-phosphate-mannose-dependent alpha-(1-2)-phosphatidylinositol mannoside mannosyltransferase n=1 Tax=Calycomorphotria hydatis TaxID=2528027 RepID=A0A517T5L7_9PLAN|nr:glycosyltransferase family 87 protein [Calycomorphotria hydatis]QDT63676.1 hypothetical protein V22_09000 [Calycomorphotria hydatis]